LPLETNYEIVMWFTEIIVKSFGDNAMKATVASVRPMLTAKPAAEPAA